MDAAASRRDQIGYVVSAACSRCPSASSEGGTTTGPNFSLVAEREIELAAL